MKASELILLLARADAISLHCRHSGSPAPLVKFLASLTPTQRRLCRRFFAARLDAKRELSAASPTYPQSPSAN